MELNAMKCPSCGALLKYDTGSDNVKCEYCGCIHFFDLNDEDRNIKAAKKLAEDVRNYRTTLLQMNDAEDNKNIAEHSLSGSKHQNTLVGYLFIPVLFLIWLFAAWITKSVFAGLSNISVILFNIVTFPFICAEGAGLALGGVPLYNYLSNRGLNKVSTAEQEYKESEEKFNKIKADFDIDFIPEKYRDEEILLFLINQFDTQRAFTLQQAINLYEDKEAQDAINKRHEQELEHMRIIQEQNEQLLKQNNKAASGNDSVLKGVLAGGAVAAGGMIAKKVAKEVLNEISKK